MNNSKFRFSSLLSFSSIQNLTFKNQNYHAGASLLELLAFLDPYAFEPCVLCLCLLPFRLTTQINSFNLINQSTLLLLALSLLTSNSLP